MCGSRVTARAARKHTFPFVHCTTRSGRVMRGRPRAIRRGVLRRRRARARPRAGTG
jgi:hypothetical protein